VALHYGDPDAEARALRTGAGLLDRSWVGGLELTGADRQRFLHGLVTCDVKGLAPGAGAHGFFTQVKGRVLAEVLVLARADRLWLELPADAPGPLAEHLSKYRIADRVEVAPLAAVALAVAGPRAAVVLAAAGLPAPAERWAHAAGTLAGLEVAVARHGRLGAEGFALWAPVEGAGAAVEALLAAGGAAGVLPVGFLAAEAVRVEAGVLRGGVDFGPDHFPQETGIDEAVSYTKGCYLGQEVVARIHYRGGVHRSPRGLVFDDGCGAPGAALLHEGREAGTATTVVRSPALGRTVGLAILHERAAAAGTRLEVAGGGGAVVRELPLA
jgi:folate-binding protein YgfZ